SAGMGGRNGKTQEPETAQQTHHGNRGDEHVHPGAGGEAAIAAAISTAPVAISVANVSKVFDLDSGPLTAVSDVSFDVRDREFVALVGPSGCGKSTLLRLVSDLDVPTSGVIAVGGEPPGSARRHRLFGVVFQDPVLLPWLDVLAN